MAVLTKIAKQAAQLILLLELATLCSSTPITSTPRRANMNNLDILVHDGNGTLVRATPSQRREILQKRQEPGQVTNIGSGACKYAKTINDIAHPACSLFCDIQSLIVDGAPQTVSADVDCTLPTCSTAYSYATTVTDSFSVNAGITASYAKSGITAQATLGYTHTWSTSIGTTNTYTFNPVNGDVGHIIFIPYMEEVCGSLTIFENSGEYYECLDWSKHADGVNQNHVLQYDPMSCGQTPIKLENGSADGVSSLFLEV
jgi:hypothetical protein